MTKLTLEQAQEGARMKSLQPEYKSCTVALNCTNVSDVVKFQHAPMFSLSDWTGGETIEVYVNGRVLS